MLGLQNGPLTDSVGTSHFFFNSMTIFCHIVFLQDNLHRFALQVFVYITMYQSAGEKTNKQKQINKNKTNKKQKDLFDHITICLCSHYFI